MRGTLRPMSSSTRRSRPRLAAVLAVATALLLTTAGACGGGGKTRSADDRLGPSKVLSDFPGTPCAATIQTDGKILVVGGSRNAGAPGAPSNVVLARYLLSGRFDRTFGRGGTVVTRLGQKRSAGACAVAVQPNGRVVVAGRVDLLDRPQRIDIDRREELMYASDLALVRYLPNGRLDGSFGNGGGKVMTSFGPIDYLDDVVLQEDGRIVAVGTSRTGVVLARYTSHGHLDSTFGTGGTVLVKLFLEFPAVAESDGTIVLAGRAWADKGVFGLAQYGSDGSLDRSFGRRGFVRTEIGFESRAADVAIQADGKIVAGGYGYGDEVALARYNNRGSLDRTFGAGGEVVTSLGPSAIAEAEVVFVQPDGKILAAGTPKDLTPRCALVRYNQNGRPDSSFGRRGKILTPFRSSAKECNALAVDVREDGRIVLVARVGNRVGVVQYA